MIATIAKSLRQQIAVSEIRFSLTAKTGSSVRGDSVRNLLPDCSSLHHLPILAATYAELDMMADAQAIVGKIKGANPAVSLALSAQVFLYRDPSIQGRFLEALRKAGLPE
jgi:hypothetical protein